MNTHASKLELIRPKTLIASISPVLLASAWALKHHTFDFFLFSLLLLTALSLQILANVANDYFDGIKGTDNKDRIGPVRFTGSGLISQEAMKKILICNFIITLCLGSLLSFYSTPLIGCIFGISLVCAILYTAGPFSFSYRGVAEPFAFSFFGPVPVFFAAYVFSKSFSLSAFLLGCLPGFYSVILITINNLRDYESDKASSKFTLIVKKGREFGKNLILACLILQILTSIVLGFYNLKFLLTLISLPEAFLFYKHVKNSHTPEAFSLLLKECAKVYATSSSLWISFTMI